MSQTQYEILILDAFTADVVKILSPTQLSEARFSRKVNQRGAFTIIFEGREQIEEVFSLFQTDTFVEVYRPTTKPVERLIKENTYITRMRHRYIDQSGTEIFIVGGFDLIDLLGTREINPADDSVQPNGGYVTKAGPADTVLRALIREQAGDLASNQRQIPGLAVSAVGGLGIPIGKRVRFENLLEVCQDIAAGSKMDFRIERGTGFSFDVIIAQEGTDKSYTTNRTTGRYTIFGVSRGNLDRPSYKIDESEEINYLYVQGPGEGANRTLLEVPNSFRVNISPLNRREKSYDARVSDVGESGAIQRLTEAREELVKRGPKIEFRLKLPANLGGITYHEDWELGDTVTVVWDDQQDDIRLIGIEFTLGVRGEDIDILIQRIN